MTVNDPEIQRIIEENIPVEIKGKHFKVIPQPSGSCDGCYFHKKVCNVRAVNICTSNGGNILKLIEQTNR